MKREVVSELLHVINDLDDKNYLMSILTYYNAPTLLKKKPATLLTLKNDNRNLKELWELHKDEFSEQTGLQYKEIKRTTNSILVIFYNEDSLHEALFEEEHINFLERFGYSSNMNLKDCLELLKDRFSQICPHEMGIFLGIPLEDVVGFIECNGENCIMCGYWKVYHNPKRAENIFFSYDKAKKNVAKSIISNRKSLYYAF